jgi:hypothetical protein
MNINRLAVFLTILNLTILTLILAQGRILSAPPTSDSLRVRSIELVDGSGQVRAQLNVESSGEVVFRLRDEGGTVRVKLGASDNGSGLLLLNDLTEPGIQLLADRDSTRITLTEQGGAQQEIKP